MLKHSRAINGLFRGSARFDPWGLAWRPGETIPADSTEISLLDAIAWLFSQHRVRQLAVGVIGPKEASARQLSVAELVGRRLGELGVQMICGGRSGVMEAACRGNLEGGGRPIGILPGDEWTEANPYVAIPLPTGLGVARNAVIARAAIALLAVGGGHGTLSEMAFGLHFDRLVIAPRTHPRFPARSAMGMSNPRWSACLSASLAWTTDLGGGYRRLRYRARPGLDSGEKPAPGVLFEGSGNRLGLPDRCLCLGHHHGSVLYPHRINRGRDRVLRPCGVSEIGPEVQNGAFNRINSRDKGT